MKLLRWVSAGLLGLALIAAGVVTCKLLLRPGLDVVAAHRAPPQTMAAQQLRLSWFGTTATLLSDGTHAILIDPFFTRPVGFLPLILNRPIAPDEALIQHWLDRAGIRQLDAVLVSHSHYDHSMDAGVVARLTGAVLLGSASTANIGRGAGLPESQIRSIQSGRAERAGPFTLTFIESRHAGATGGEPVGDITQPLTPPARYLDYKLGGAYSILIQHPQASVLHHGSAGFVPGALKGMHADTVLLGIALIDDLDEYLRQVVDTVGATRVIPMHWDDFTRPLDQPLKPFPVGVDLPGFFAEVTRLRPALTVQTLDVGRLYH